MSSPPKLHAGYLFHQEKDGRRTYSAHVERADTGHMVHFDCVANLPAAFKRAAEYVDEFPNCVFVGHLGERSHAP